MNTAILEKYGEHQGRSIEWVGKIGENDDFYQIGLVPDDDRKRLLLSLDSIRNFFLDAFLPQGYPDSVSDDYLQYQMWDTLQAFASSITGALATEAVLRGVGVGDHTATALAATVAWLLKDGMGMLGHIGFAWSTGTDLDADCKKWRLLADMVNDLAILADLLTVHLRPVFTLVVCVSSLCRAVVGVAGVATRAALTQHQTCYYGNIPKFPFIIDS